MIVSRTNRYVSLLILVLMLCLATCAIGETAINESNTYTDPTTGISLLMPPGWVAVNPADALDARDDKYMQIFFIPEGVSFDWCYQAILYTADDVWGMIDEAAKNSFKNNGFNREDFNTSLFSTEDFAASQNVPVSEVQRKVIGSREYFIFSTEDQVEWMGLQTKLTSYYALCYDNGYLHTFVLTDMLQTEEVLTYFWDTIESLLVQ